MGLGINELSMIVVVVSNVFSDTAKFNIFIFVVISKLSYYRNKNTCFLTEVNFITEDRMPRNTYSIYMKAEC